MKRFNVTSALNRVAASVGIIQANLTDEKKITDDIYRVVLCFNTSEGTKREKLLAIAKLFNGHAMPIENSFRALPESYQYSMVGYVSKNNEAIEYTEEMASSGRYKTVAANILFDESDESLWEVNSSADNSSKFLVRTGMEDLSDLVALAKLKNEVQRNRTINLSSIYNDAFVGEYAAYVDPHSCEVKYGYVIASDCVYSDDMQDSEIEALNNEPEVEILDRESLSPVKVNPELIVQSANFHGEDEDNLPKTETASEYDMGNKESMKAYYKKLYSYAPEYYAEIDKQINEHAEV